MSPSDEFDTIELQLRKKVTGAFDSIQIQSSRLISTGWNSYILLVNRRIAFKFPRNKKHAPSLEREISLVNCLGLCPVKLPFYKYVHISRGDVFGGYDFIEGSGLNSIHKLTGTIINQFALFLNCLYHKTGILLKRGCLQDTGMDSWKSNYREFSRYVREKISPRIDSDVAKELDREFMDFLRIYSSTMRVSLIHGDLYRDNVIVGYSGEKIEGVIDWEEACIGDPAIDFAAIAVDFPADQMMKILSCYSGEMDKYFLKRIEFYWKIEPIYGILHNSVKNQDAKVDMYFKTLEKRIVSGLF